MKIPHLTFDYFAEIDWESVVKGFREHGVTMGCIIFLLFLAWVVWHEVLDDPIKELLFHHQIKRRLFKHRFVEDLVSDTFEGTARLVTKHSLKDKASRARILQFYAGARLDWDIIAANGDVRRDQFSELKKCALATSNARLICITAEAGAGKSTIAWRVAAEIAHEQKELVVIQIVTTEDESVWHKMPGFISDLRKPVLILADDIFRDEDAADAFINLQPNIAATILATSRRNEFRVRAKRLKFAHKEFRLQAPSAKEKTSVLEAIGKPLQTLTPHERRRMDDAEQFIVLMIELVGGKELSGVIRDTIERLSNLEPNQSAYRAYSYVCFAGQFGVPISVSLLERLDRSFHGVAERQVVDGLIFRDSQPGYIRSGHAVVAQAAATIYSEELGRSPHQIVCDLISSIDYASRTERQSVGQILRALAASNLVKNDVLFSLIRPCVSKSMDEAGDITELMIWRGVCRNCGNIEWADKCANKLITFRPTTSGECCQLFHTFRQQGRESDALGPISEWIDKHPNDAHVYVPYSVLIEKFERKKIPEVLFKHEQLLQSEQANSHLWSSYFGLIERNAPHNKLLDAIRRADKWLLKTENVDDSNTRAALLALIRRRWPALTRSSSAGRNDWFNKRGLIKADIISAIIEKNCEWVKKNPFRPEVWDALLGLLFSSGQYATAAELAAQAIGHNQNDQNILIHYLRGLYQSNESAEKIKTVFEDLMKKYPGSFGAKIAHATWLRDKCSFEEAEAFYHKLCVENPTGYEPRSGLGYLYFDAGRYKDAAEQFRKVLEMPMGSRHQMALAGLGQSLWKLGEKPQIIEKQFELALKSAKRKGQPTAYFKTLLGRFYLDYKKWPEAIACFNSAKEEDPEYFGNYWGLGQALFGSGRLADALTALRQATSIKPDLQPPASDEIRNLIGQCLQRLQENDHKTVSLKQPEEH